MSKFRFDLKARDARKAFREMNGRIGDIAVKYTKEKVFPSQSWDGLKWKYRKGERLIKDRARPIGVKTGAMKASVKKTKSDAQSVKWGATVPYAGYFNKGTTKMPARQFIGLDRGLSTLIKIEVNSTLKRIFR